MEGIQAQLIALGEITQVMDSWSYDLILDFSGCSHHHFPLFSLELEWMAGPPGGVP